jgi:hypothetical protein
LVADQQDEAAHRWCRAWHRPEGPEQISYVWNSAGREVQACPLAIGTGGIEVHSIWAVGANQTIRKRSLDLCHGSFGNGIRINGQLVPAHP